MSKLKHLIHKVTSATNGKRNSLKSTPNDEGEIVHTPGHQTVVGFVETSGEVHPPNGTNRRGHGRRRNRTVSLTDEKILRSEARNAAEETEKRKHDAEKKKAYEEVPTSPHILWCLR